jgi:hypothetical protein
MADNTKDMRGNVPKLPEVKPYEPVPYDMEGTLDPFKPNKIEPESRYKQLAGKGGRSSLISKHARFGTACWRNIPSNRSK